MALNPPGFGMRGLNSPVTLCLQTQVVWVRHRLKMGKGRSDAPF